MRGSEGEEMLSKEQQLQIAYFFKNSYEIKIPSKSRDLIILQYKPLLAAFESVTEVGIWLKIRWNQTVQS